MRNMTSTIELLKEKIRVSSSDMEDNASTVTKHDEVLRDLQQQILTQKKVLSNLVKDETKDLKQQILMVKKYFDDNKDHVTQFDSSLSFIKQ